MRKNDSSLFLSQGFLTLIRNIYIDTDRYFLKHQWNFQSINYSVTLTVLLGSCVYLSLQLW